MELIELLFTRFFLKAQQFIFKCIHDFLWLCGDEYLCLESCVLLRLCLLCIVNPSCLRMVYSLRVQAHNKSTSTFQVYTLIFNLFCIIYTYWTNDNIETLFYSVHVIK